MREFIEQFEKLGPDARLRFQLAQLEANDYGTWILVIFAGAVLLLGAFSFLAPASFWRANQLEVRVSPQVLFLVMMALLLGALYFVRRETEIRRLQMANLRQTLNAQAGRATSFLDALTNVFSRNCLIELLQGEIARAERNDRPLALLMCDIDNFKKFNDRHGHLMGDYALAQVAGIIKSCVRGSDYVIRYGGDEFLVILPETIEWGAEVVRSRIKEKVLAWNQESRGEVPIGISLGLLHHVAGETVEKDLAEVDRLMYEDKRRSGSRAIERRRAARSG